MMLTAGARILLHDRRIDRLAFSITTTGHLAPYPFRLAQCVAAACVGSDAGKQVAAKVVVVVFCRHDAFLSARIKV